MLCASAGPDSRAGLQTWENGVRRLGDMIATLLCFAGPLPTPNADMLRWTNHEIGMMITYNMATYVPNCTGNGLCASVGGCNAQLEGLPPVDTFAPTSLDTDQWVDAMIEYGAKYGILVIQHCSGFSMFETNEFVLNATGFNYTYGVEFASWGGGKRDVMREFVDSCKRKGVKPGVYYSLNHNWYLNAASSVVQPGPLKPGQVSVTQKQYEAIALAQYTALLTRYGDMAEEFLNSNLVPINYSL